MGILSTNSSIKADLYDLFRPYMDGPVVIGYFRPKEGTKGCFEHKDFWYVYDTDEKGCVIRGPFNGRDIVYAVALELGIAREFEAYRFSDSVEDIYLHCNFKDINELP